MTTSMTSQKTSTTMPMTTPKTSERPEKSHCYSCGQPLPQSLPDSSAPAAPRYFLPADAQQTQQTRRAAVGTVDIVVAISQNYEQVFVDGQSVVKVDSPAALSELFAACHLPFRMIWYYKADVEKGVAHPETITEAEIIAHLTGAYDEQGTLLS